MTHVITYLNYRFDIELGKNQISIKVFDTNTMDLFEGTVNEHEIYINPIDKFEKLLVSALKKHHGFSIEVTKSSDTIKGKLTYKTYFIELDETFSLNKISEPLLSYIPVNNYLIGGQLILSNIQAIRHDNYQFNMILTHRTEVSLEIYDNNTMELFGGTVQEHETNFKSILKFYKLLSLGLNRIKNYSIEITKSSNLSEIRCNLLYNSNFFEWEESFVLFTIKQRQFNFNLFDKHKLMTQHDDLQTQVDTITNTIVKNSSTNTYIYKNFKKPCVTFEEIIEGKILKTMFGFTDKELSLMTNFKNIKKEKHRIKSELNKINNFDNFITIELENKRNRLEEIGDKFVKKGLIKNKESWMREILENEKARLQNEHSKFKNIEFELIAKLKAEEDKIKYEEYKLIRQNY